MNKIKILHTADIHIGASANFLKGVADLRRFETLITFEKIIDLGISRSVDIIAISGDLFDSNTIEDRFVSAVFSKIASAQPIKVIFAAGNHDPLNNESPFLNRDLPENLYVLGVADECITFDDIQLNVFGRSFAHTYLEGEPKLTIKPDNDYINVLVQHGELKSDLNSEYNAITPMFVKTSSMDYIALGHVHKSSEIGRIGNTFFAYCGCPEGQGFDELDQKGVYIGEIGHNFCDMQFVSVSKRQHISCEVDISDCNNTESICNAIFSKLQNSYGDAYGNNLYKIILTGEVDEQTEIIISEITSRLAEKIYFVKVKNLTEYKIDYSVVSKEPSLFGVFVKKMLEKEKDADDEQRNLYRKALKLGIKAFRTEIKYDED